MNLLIVATRLVEMADFRWLARVIFLMLQLLEGYYRVFLYDYGS